MRATHRHIFLNLFIMLAIIGAGISPACKFISGSQTWLEICGAEGIKKVLVAFDETPDAPQDQDHASAEPCAFCITHASVKVTAAAETKIALPYLELSAAYIARHDGVHLSANSKNALARGPPVIL